MNTSIFIAENDRDQVWEHILQPHDTRESAAFLFAKYDSRGEQKTLDVKDIRLISGADFKTQESDYIELSDEARISVIKKAHREDYALIEIHSHPFPGKWAAGFSQADMNGFAETVPNMLWRLPNRPYSAIVAAHSGFDALTWPVSFTEPESISALIVNNEISKPTNYTLGGMNGKYSRRTI